MNSPDSLAAWLAYSERLHARPIDLGLERVRVVAQRLGIRFDCPVIVVGGTNGKGSTCAMLDAILRAAGYRTGLYTSPHLLHFNERARVVGVEASDAALIEQFAAVEAVRSAAALPLALVSEDPTVMAAGLAKAGGVAPLIVAATFSKALWI